MDRQRSAITRGEKDDEASSVIREAVAVLGVSEPACWHVRSRHSQRKTTRGGPGVPTATTLPPLRLHGYSMATAAAPFPIGLS
jgi:hypothetical protein